MTSPRERVGGAYEASRLLQEGLELLTERTREVDAVVQQAHERARQHVEAARERALEITADAEMRAEEITANAERSRADVEAQLAAMREELGEARRELGEARRELGEARRELGELRAAPPILIDTSSMPEASDASTPPRWGRRATMPQATPNRAGRARPGWLPPWLPFMLILLAGVAIVAAMFGEQAGAG